MFHSFFNYRARSRYLSFFHNYCRFLLWSAGIAIIIIIYSFRIFHWSLSDSKSPQVSRTFLGILVVLKIYEWSPHVRQLPSPSGSLIILLLTVPKAPITIGIIVTCTVHIFFNSLARYLSFFSHFFNFILWSTGTAKSTILQFFFFCWLLFGLVS